MESWIKHRMVKQLQACKGVLRTSLIRDDSAEREHIYQRIQALLLDGQFTNGMNFECVSRKNKLGQIFSIRLNKKVRLICTKLIINDKWFWVMLNVLERHQYHREKTLKASGLEQLLLGEWPFLEQQALALSSEVTTSLEEPDSEILSVTTRAASPWVEETFSSDWVEFEFFNHQLIALNSEQHTVLNKSLPLIITGSAGSGKSLLASSILLQYLESLEAPTEQVLYVTSSLPLRNKMQHSWRHSPEFDAQYDAHLEFLTYETLLQRYYPEVQLLQVVGESYFSQWLKKNKKCLPSARLRDVDIYQELRLISGYQRDEYYALGKRRSMFNLLEDRQQLWDLYWRYCQYLSDQKAIDYGFYPSCSVRVEHKKIRDGAALALIDLEPQFVRIMIDEAQDFSGLQQLLLQSVVQQRQLACFMDTNQNLFDSLSKMQFLKEKLFVTDEHCIHLKHSFRCAQKILQFANIILNMKYFVSGGILEKDGQSYTPIPELDGGALFFTAETEEVMQALKQDTASVNCAVLTIEAELVNARRLFPGANVMTVAQAKGLEFEKIIAFRLLQQPFFEDINKDFQDWLPDLSVEFCRPKQGEARFNLAPVFNELYTACTRARHQLHFLDDRNEKDHKVGQIIRILKGGIDSLTLGEPKVLSLPVSSEAEWRKQAKLYISRGQIDLAQEICLHHLDMQPEQFKIFHDLVLTESPVSSCSSPISSLTVSTTKSSSPVPILSRPPRKEVKTPDMIHRPVAKSITPSWIEHVRVHLEQSNDGFKWLLDDAYEAYTCFLEWIVYDQNKVEIFLDLLDRNPKTHKPFLLNLCRTRQVAQHSSIKNDSGLGLLTRYENGYLILAHFSPNYYFRLVNHQLFGAALCRLAQISQYPCRQITPLFMMTSVENGIDLLANFLHEKPELIASFSPQAMSLYPLNDDHLKEASVIFFLMASAKGRELIKRFPSILELPNSSTICNILNPPLVRYLNSSILYDLTCCEESRMILKHILYDGSKFMKLITREALLRPVLIDDQLNQGYFPFLWLCKTVQGRKILAKSTSLGQLIDAEVLSAVLSPKIVQYSNMTILFLLISCAEGREFLLANSHLFGAITLESICRLVKAKGEYHHNSSVLYWLVRTEEGLIIFDKLLNAQPNMARQFNEQYLCKDDLIIYDERVSSPFTCLSASENGMNILLAHPDLLRGVTRDGLSTHFGKLFISPCYFSPLYLLSLTLKGRQVLLTAIERIPDFKHKISAEALFYVLGPNVEDDLENTSVLYWLSSNDSGRLILKHLFRETECSFQITEQALCTSRFNRNEEASGSSPLYWLTCNQVGRELLINHPHLLQKIRVDALYQMILSNGYHYQYTSPFYWLALTSIGHKILLLLYAFHPKWIECLPTEVICTPKSALAEINPCVPLIVDMVTDQEQSDFLDYLIENDPSLPRRVTPSLWSEIYSSQAEVLESTSLFFWLCKEFNHNLTTHILEVFPELVNYITSEALCTPYMGSDLTKKNSSALYLLTETVKGRQLFSRILEVYPDFAKLLTSNALQLSLTEHSGQLNNATPLYWLLVNADGLELLSQLFKINVSLISGLTLETMLRDAPMVDEEHLFEPIFQIMKSSEIGEQLYQMICEQHPDWSAYFSRLSTQGFFQTPIQEEVTELDKQYGL
jgi:hypothetical protein